MWNQAGHNSPLSADRRKVQQDFKDWLAKMHAELDKETTFRELDVDKTRETKGFAIFKTLCFGLTNDSSTTFQVGDKIKVVRERPHAYGEIVGFKVKCPGAAPADHQGSGQVEIARYPEELYGGRIDTYEVGRIDPSQVC